MILINKVTTYAYQTYKKELFECLIKNCGLGLISKILVFVDNTNIILPKNDKIQIVVKNNYTDYELIEYSKRISNSSNFIFANPFATFNHTLMNVDLKNKDIVFNENAYFFNKDSEIYNGSNLFESCIANNRIVVESKQSWSNEIRHKFTSKDKNINKPILSKKNQQRIQRYLFTSNIQPKNPEKNFNVDVVIVSVDYNDFLSITLENTIKFFNVTVVTSSSDKVCKSICDKYGVNCVITDKMYENGNTFNKGKAINEGIKSIKNPGWILLLDADIYLEKELVDLIKPEKISVSSIYFCKRLILNDYDSFQKYLQGEKVGTLERGKGFGYLQLFYFNSNRFYPESYGDASGSDLIFRDQFSNKVELDSQVVHLGHPYKNWKGRITPIFEKKNKKFEIFSKIIPESKPEIPNLELDSKKISNFKVITTMSPKNDENQQFAMKSWSDYEIYSVNSEDDIKILENLYPNINFIKTDKLTNYKNKKLVKLDALLDLSEKFEDFCIIVNSDIILKENYRFNFDASLLTNSIIIGTRYEVTGNKIYRYPFGYDLMIFEPKNARLFKNDNYTLGLPWWDYYVPTVALNQGLSTYNITNEIIYHKTHSTNYDTDIFMQLAKAYYNDVLVNMIKSEKELSFDEFMSGIEILDIKKFIDFNLIDLDLEQSQTF